MQNIANLSDEIVKNIEAKRDWVKNHYTPASIHEYDTIDGKLHILDIMLKSGWIEKNEILKLQCLGITLVSRQANFV